MRHSWDITVIGRLLLVLAVVVLLGITPRSHALTNLFWQVNQALEKGLPGEAARLMEEIARQFPWRNDLWQRIGNYAWQAGDYPSTILYMQKAAQYQALSSESKYHLAVAFLSQGALDEAEELLIDIRKNDPNRDVYINLFQIHRVQKDYAAVLDDIRMLSVLEPENANLYYLSGLLQMALQPDQALSLLDKASSLDDNFEPTVSAVADSLLLVQLSDDPVQGMLTGGQILAALEEWELASEAFRQATLVEPDHASAWAFLGESRQHANGSGSFYANLYPLATITREMPESLSKNDDGYSDLQKALELDPQFATTHIFLSLYWARQHRYDLALTFIDKAIIFQPEEATLYSQRGSIQGMLGDLSGALESYQHAVKLSEHPQASHLLISFCVAYDYQVREAALPAVRTLLQAEPQDVVALDLAGQVFYLLDNPAAKIYLEKALAQDAGYAPAHLHLGLYYLELGELTMAKEEFSLARSLSPDSSTGDQAQRLLDTYLP
ncbi:MAG: tetratricopeptide repeat protein [Anaerolineales bacterium]|nr:tetratricopeptide repeat protein [Anaerolineales bacterium]